MATLEDTFRMMKGEEPVNTDKLSAVEENINQHKVAFNNLGTPPKVSSNFMDSVKETLVEARGGVPIGGKQLNGDQLRQKKLVENGKTLIAHADLAMYEVKKNGGNAVIAHGDY